MQVTKEMKAGFPSEPYFIKCATMRRLAWCQFQPHTGAEQLWEIITIIYDVVSFFKNTLLITYTNLRQGCHTFWTHISIIRGVVTPEKRGEKQKRQLPSTFINQYYHCFHQYFHQCTSLPRDWRTFASPCIDFKICTRWDKALDSSPALKTSSRRISMRPGKGTPPFLLQTPLSSSCGCLFYYLYHILVPVENHQARADAGLMWLM